MNHGPHERVRSHHLRILFAAATVLAISGPLATGGCRKLYAEESTPSEPAAPSNPFATFALPKAERLSFEGRVVDRLDAGSYVYLEVERSSGERSWTVTLSSSDGAKRGVEAVRVVAVGYASDFESKRLGRTFDGLYFAVVRPA